MTDQSREQQPSRTKRDQATGPATHDHDLPENSKENLDRKLDEGVEETFPASDPVAVTITK
jgi:hypothetical protein